MLSRPVRPGGDEADFEVIRGWKYNDWTARSQHLATFWHVCRNLCSVRRPLQKLPRQSKYEKRNLPVKYFCASSKKGLRKKVVPTFRPQDLIWFFSRGSGPRATLNNLRPKSLSRNISLSLLSVLSLRLFFLRACQTQGHVDKYHTCVLYMDCTLIFDVLSICFCM